MADEMCECGWSGCTLCAQAPKHAREYAINIQHGIERRFAKCGHNVKIYPLAKIIGSEHLEIGHDVIIDDHVWMSLGKGSKIGSWVHIAVAATMQGRGEFVIGDFCSVAAGARLYTAGDDLHHGALVNPCVPEKYRSAYRAPLVMERHSIVATNAVVMAGTTIGEGAIVGACSWVPPNSKLEPWAIYAGAPARIISRRNRDEVLRREGEFLAELVKGAA